MFVSYISTQGNEVAYNTINKKLGYSDIDLFASRFNRKCNLYVSWHTDTEAYDFNAYTMCAYT